MQATNTTTRTYLCPACEGWGQRDESSSNDPQCENLSDCTECAGTGVVRATYVEADDQGLRPWTGDRGLTIAGQRAAARRDDPLLVISRTRKSSPFYYGHACRAAFAPVLETLAAAEREISARPLREAWARIGWGAAA